MTGASIDRILCPTDFSLFSSQALRHALALARAFHARLKVVHVILDSIPGVEAVYGGVPWLPTAADRQRVDEEMHRFLEPAREARVDHETEVREGEPWREIVDAAREMEADLVVMGTHGRGGFEHLVLGSVAEVASVGSSYTIRFDGPRDAFERELRAGGAEVHDAGRPDTFDVRVSGDPGSVVLFEAAKRATTRILELASSDAAFS